MYIQIFFCVVNSRWVLRQHPRGLAGESGVASVGKVSEQSFLGADRRGEPKSAGQKTLCAARAEPLSLVKGSCVVAICFSIEALNSQTSPQNILDRRLRSQSEILPVPFSQYLRNELQAEDISDLIDRGLARLREDVERYRNNPRYAEWVAKAEAELENHDLDSLRDFYSTRILLARDALKRQMSLERAPLSTKDLDHRDSSQVGGAAEIFMHEELKIPYYFGFERLCGMATNNVEELLFLSAKFYEALKAKQILRKAELLLSPKEQEKLLKESALRKREFIPKNHTEGSRGQLLLDAIGSYCRERTFLPNAPYAPGVTGVRLSFQELGTLNSGRLGALGETLTRVLAECAAENLLISRPSAASTSRDGGTVFYLNRTLCAQYGLPLQTGGWQDVKASKLIEWMERGRIPGRLQHLGAY
jgi:hypothetical protein